MAFAPLHIGMTNYCRGLMQITCCCQNTQFNCPEHCFSNSFMINSRNADMLEEKSKKDSLQSPMEKILPACERNWKGFAFGGTTVYLRGIIYPHISGRTFWPQSWNWESLETIQTDICRFVWITMQKRPWELDPKKVEHRDLIHGNILYFYNYVIFSLHV